MALALKKSKPPGGSLPQEAVQTKKTPSGRKSGKSAKSAFIVFIGDEGAILVATRGNKSLRRLFAPSPQPEHMKSMVELMQSQPGVPLYLFLDVIDQQYVRQTFPPVSSLSVSKLVNRRLQRDFPPEDIKGAIPLGRESGGRKEWSYLLVSLSKTPQLQTWLDTLLEMPNECKGLFLSPVEGQVLIPQLLEAIAPGNTAPWKLLVSHNKVGGVRQIVLRDGKLAFTRLTQTPDDTNFALTAGNIEQEMQNTLDYLRRLGFSDNRDMSAAVIASQEVKDLIDLKRFGMGMAECVTPFEVSQLLNLEQAALSGDRYGDVVIASAFASARKKSYTFMSGYAKQLSQIYMAKRAIKFTVMGIAALCFFSVIEDTLNIISNGEVESRTREELNSVNEQANKAQTAISSLDKDTSLWTSVVSTYDAFFPDQHLPTEFIEALAPLLDSNIRASLINWSRPVPDPKAPPAPPPVPGAAPVPPPGSIEAEVEIEFNGSYEDQDQYVRAVGEYFDRLKAALPQYIITSENMPGKGQGAAKLEISFDQQQQQPFQQGQNKVRFKFAGPLPPDPSKPPVEAAPAPSPAAITAPADTAPAPVSATITAPGDAAAAAALESAPAEIPATDTVPPVAEPAVPAAPASPATVPLVDPAAPPSLPLTPPGEAP